MGSSSLCYFKKLLLSLVAVCFLGLGAQAQEVFHKGDIVGNLQIGVGTYEGYGIGIPPTSISVDVGAFDNLIQGKNGSIGIGGYFGFGTYRDVYKVDNIRLFKSLILLSFSDNLL